MSTTKVTADVLADTLDLSGKSVTLAAGEIGASELAATLDLSGKSVTLAAGEVGASELAATLDLSGKTLTLPTANTPAFTKSFTSSNQTITAAGALTLAHALGVMPTLVQVRLKCTTAELGYSIGDEVIANPMVSHTSSSRGVSVVPDATNLNIRFGSDANSLSVIRKDTGAIADITNASWAAIFKAWA